jgi:hypothetical protein
MGYIDIFIPFSIGILLIFNPNALLKPDDVLFERKKKTLKKCGYGLIGVAVVYGGIKIFS